MSDPNGSCAALDRFFDGELSADRADAFRDHLAACERCQRVLHGRMQEHSAIIPALTERARTAERERDALRPVVQAAERLADASRSRAFAQRRSVEQRIGDVNAAVTTLRRARKDGK